MKVGSSCSGEEARQREEDVKCPEDFNPSQLHTDQIMSDLQLQCSSAISNLMCSERTLCGDISEYIKQGIFSQLDHMKSTFWLSNKGLTGDAKHER